MSLRLPLLPLLVVFAIGVRFAGADDQLSTPGVWPVERLESEIPNYRIEDSTAKIQSLIYEGEPVDAREIV